MTEKKKKESGKPKIEIQTRKPEKRGIFANVGQNRSTDAHPLREILNFPAQSADSEISADRTNDENISKDQMFGYPNSAPLDSQTLLTGNPNRNILEIQNDTTGYPSKLNLDSQESELSYPNSPAQAVQTEKTGYPKTDSAVDLDIKIAKESNRIAKTGENLDIKIAPEKILDSPTVPETGKWKKYDKARSTASVFIRAAEELVNEIKHFNVEKGLDMREFFELSARAFIDGFGYPNENDLAINIALDDRRLMMMYKTKGTIINLFRAYNRILTPNTDWKPKDDVVGVKYNEVDFRIVEIGIIVTQTNLLENNSDTQISRFKYYTREIEKALALGFGDETLDAMLKSYRKRWSEITKRQVDLSFLESNQIN